MTYEKEEFIKRKEFINNDKNKLTELREKRNGLIQQISNLKYDILIFPDRYDFKERKNILETELDELKDKITFFIVDIHMAELKLKKDRKETSKTVLITKHNKETLKYAENNHKPYSDDDIKHIILNCSDYSKFPNEEIDECRKKFKRTYLAIQAIIRFKEKYLETGEVPEFYQLDRWEINREQIKRVLDELIKLKHFTIK